MSTIIYPSPIFGPVHSRRLGVSLGINLLPDDGKWCSFDCVYCECGLNADHRANHPLPTREQVTSGLEERLKDMQQNGPAPDVLTFAGNGEPTMHPAFPQIVDDVIVLRNRYFPKARISVLTNSTQIHRKEVLEALLKIDNPILKLDTVSDEYIHRIDRPSVHYQVEQLVRIMSEHGKEIIIQSMFMTGMLDGKSVDNTTSEYVERWLQAIQRIQPRQVMIYTIDRETPVSTLAKATHEQLDCIADRVRALGVPCSVSY